MLALTFIYRFRAAQVAFRSYSWFFEFASGAGFSEVVAQIKLLQITFSFFSTPEIGQEAKRSIVVN
jgi:hypothetical protein